MDFIDRLYSHWVDVRFALKKQLPSNRTDRTLLTVSLVAFVFAAAGLVAVMGWQPYEHQLEVGILTSAGSVKRREARSVVWEEIHKGDSIYLRDTLRLYKTGAATVMFTNDKQIELAPGSVVQVEEIFPHRIEMSVYQGKVGPMKFVTLRESEPLHVIPAGERPILAMPQILPH